MPGLAQGFNDQAVRAISENIHTLKFYGRGFDER